MSRFTVTDLPLVGLKLIQRHSIGDHRGSLTRVFCGKDLAAAGWVDKVSQVNHTYTEKKGTIRGLHFQYPPYSEMKLVSCLRGEVWDVAVDLRRGSPTFLQWHAEHLSEENGRALLIPEGFAHGFQSLMDEAEVLYFVSAPYSPESEGGFRPEDPALSIPWPIDPTEISLRDRGHPLIGKDFSGMIL